MTLARDRASTIAILALAAALRLPLVFSGLPYISYVDEGGVLHPVTRLVRSGGWDPGWYQYPSLSMYLTVAVLHASRPIYRLAHGRPLAADLPPEGDLYDLIAPPEVILAGRGVVAAASLVTVLLGMALARRLAGRSAAIVAGLLLAMTPALVQRGCIVITDTLSAAFVAGVLLAAEHLRSLLGSGEGPPSLAARRHALLAGALAGLAAATKYPAGAVFVVVLLAVFAGGVSFERVRLAALSALAAILATLTAMPALVFSTRQVVTGLVAQAKDYATFPNTRGLFRQALYAEELGWLLTFAGLLGLVLLALRREPRPAVAAWLVFGGLLLAPLLRYGFQPFRNALPLVPPFVVAASCLFGDRSPLARWRGARLFTAAILLVSLTPGLFGAWDMRRHTDMRVFLVNELARDRWVGKRVLVERELAILPAELRRSKAAVTVAPWSEMKKLAGSEEFDAVVFGDFDTTSAPPDFWLAGLEEFRSWTASLPLVIAVGNQRTPVLSGLWRTWDERVRLALLVGPRNTIFLQGDVPLGRVGLDPASAPSFFTRDGKTPGRIEDTRRLGMLLSAGATVTWRVDVPAGARTASFRSLVRTVPEESFNTRAVSVSVSIGPNGPTIASRVLLPRGEERELVLDLSRFAGKTVRLSLYAEGTQAPGAPLLWDAPRIELNVQEESSTPKALRP
ncbi:MAG: phospholipid carrier-dependent glycosyltransferase [Thermoanaerobaculia bacterium]